MIKRMIIAIAIFVAMGGVAVYVIYRMSINRAVTRMVSGVQKSVQAWVREQVIAIVNDHLGVTFGFDSFTLEGGDTAVFTGVAFSAGDLTFLAADVLRIELAQMPRFGEPIVIGNITARSPIVRLVPDDDGMRGWGSLIASDGGSERADGGSTRLSDVFAIRQINLEEGLVEYAPIDQPVMRFEGITAQLDATQIRTSVYAIQTSIERSPLLSLSIDGELNLESGRLAMTSSQLAATLARDGYQFLPPRVQSFMQQHKMTGSLRTGASGQVSLTSPMEIRLSGDLHLDDSQIVFEKAALPIESLAMQWSFSEGLLSIPSLEASTLDGTVMLNGTVDFGNLLVAQTIFSARDLRIEQAIRIAQGGNATSYAGKLDLDGQATAEIGSLLDSLRSDGTVQVTEGTLVNVPVINDLVHAAGDAKVTGTDQLDARFAIIDAEPRTIQFEDIDLVSATVAARGGGKIGFDGAIDFLLNAGPLEKAQSLLGVIGDAFGALTDQLMKYHLTGTIRNVTVNVRPLGIDLD